MTDLVKEIFNKSELSSEEKDIIKTFEKAYKNWEIVWSKFISAPKKEESMRVIKKLEGIHFFAWGGYLGAERQRICLSRKPIEKEKELPFMGINIEGNFLFERVTKEEFRNTFINLGYQLDEIGDIWLNRDRGAQLICTPKVALELNGLTSHLKDVEIRFEALELEKLNLPHYRNPKKIKSVEASLRLDAISSAGFGISRAKIVDHIKNGRLRLNWEKVKQVSKSVNIGDKIQLEEKGILEVVAFEITKRGRWKIELIRN